MSHVASEVLQDAFASSFGRLPHFMHRAEFVPLARIPAIEESGLEDRGDALGSFSVLTVNIWAKRAPVLVHAQIQAIRKHNPDVICLQEAFHMCVIDAYRAAFPDYYLICFGVEWTPVATFLIVVGLLVLSSILFFSLIAVTYMCGMQRMEWWIIDHPRWILLLTTCLSVIGVLFKNHYFVAFLIGNKTGLAMLVRRDLLKDYEHSCVLFSYPWGHAADFLNSMRPRGFLFATGCLRLKNGDDFRVRFATTHLNQPPDQPLAVGRHRQVNELLEAGLRDDELFVLGADLNATPPGTIEGTNCSTYVDLTRHLSDAWVETNASDPNEDGLTWDQAENPKCLSPLNTFFYGGRALRWRCDFILWRQHRAEVTSTGTTGTPTSSSSGSCGIRVAKDASFSKSAEKGKANRSDLLTTVQSCRMVFSGDDAVSDHHGVLAVYQIHGPLRISPNFLS